MTLAPAVQFSWTASGESDVGIVAYQHISRSQMSAKTAGRLKAMGCVMGDPRGWTPPWRVPFDTRGAAQGQALYVGAGAKQYRLQPSFWSRFLKSGPGLNRRQAMELYEAGLGDDSIAMQRLWELDGAPLGLPLRVFPVVPCRRAHQGV